MSPGKEKISAVVKVSSFLRNIKFARPGSASGVTAVEIGNDWLKIVRKDRAKSGKVTYQIRLSKLAQIKDSVSSAIADIFRDFKIDKQHVTAYIPRHLVTIRMLDLPATDPKEISDMINLQVGKQTPYSKEEIVYSHKIVEIGPMGYAKVMLVIAARNIINERMYTLESAGLSVDRVAISSEGVYSWFQAAYMQDIKLDDYQGVAVVDIDSNYSDFIVMRRGKMAFTRNIFIGANHLTHDATEWRDKFVDELKRSMERYQTEEKSVKVVKVFLSGAARNIKGLDIVLSSNLEVPVENADQLKNIYMRNSVDMVRDESFRCVSLTQLLGAAIGDKDPHIDLTTGEQKVQNLMEVKRKQLTVMGILVIAIVTMLSFLLAANISGKNTYLAKLKSMISKIEGDASSVDEMRAVIGLVEKRLDSRGSSIEAVNEIYRITPREIYLTGIDIDEKQAIILKGAGLAMSDVFKYVKGLEESDMFETVKATRTTTRKDKDSEFAEFEISCTYQK